MRPDALPQASSSLYRPRMPTTRLPILIVSLAFSVLCAGTPVAHAQDSARVDPWALAQARALGRSPSLGTEATGDWRAPYVARLRNGRRSWITAWVIVSAVSTTALFPAPAVDDMAECVAFDDDDFCEGGLPVGSLIVAPAVGFTHVMAAAGAFGALGTLDMIDRRIHYTGEPAFLGREFRDIGLPLTVAGHLSFTATIAFSVLSVPMWGFIPLAIASAIVGNALLHAGETWLFWGRRIAVDHGARPGPALRQWRPQPPDFEGMPDFLRVPLP